MGCAPWSEKCQRICKHFKTTIIFSNLQFTQIPQLSPTMFTAFFFYFRMQSQDMSYPAFSCHVSLVFKSVSVALLFFFFHEIGVFEEYRLVIL